MSRRKTTCEGCGCNCKDCSDSVGSLHLHVEIENLKQRLLERENHIVSMETNFLREAEKFPNGEMAALTDELLTWQDKYSRLYESHKRVQKVNQNLEDKLLRIVDKCETEKNILTAEVSALTRRLVDEKFTVSKLQEENERYRNDVNLAIQLLQCKPSNFVPQKYDSLPNDLQQKVRSYVSSKRRMSASDNQQKPPEIKTIKVPIPTFPPTAMVYSVNKHTNDKEGPTSGTGTEERSSKQGGLDIVSAAIMAKVLEERERERSQMKHCDSCTCPSGTNSTESIHNSRQQNKETQTDAGSDIDHLINNNIGSVCNDVTSNGLNLEHVKVVNTNVVLNSKENYMSCPSKNNTISSPMNIKCSKFSSNGNVPLNIVGALSTTNWDTSTNDSECPVDFFTEFDMSPKVDSTTRIEETANIGKKSSNKSSDTDVFMMSNQNCSALSINKNENDLSHSCRVVVENNRNCNSVSSSNSDNVNNNSAGCDKGVSDSLFDDESDNLISFDKPIQSASSGIAVTLPAAVTVLGGNLNVSSGSGSKPGSVRHCSVRLQAGTSNILLDNVVDGPYAPVLYKSRLQSSYDPLLVHTPPSRSISASSSVSSIFNEDHPRYQSDNTIVPNAGVNSSSSSTYSISSSSSTPSSLSSSSLRKNNLTLAQIRTETEI